MRLVAFDPGYERLGIAVLDKEGGAKEELVYSDCFTTSPKKEFTERLYELLLETQRVIESYKPEACAIENLFLSNNQKTAMRVSEVRGALLSVALLHKLPIYEYTPLQIKAAITGDGKSDKQRMMWMVPKLIHIQKDIPHDDEYDAIAVGLTCFAHEKF